MKKTVSRSWLKSGFVMIVLLLLTGWIIWAARAGVQTFQVKDVTCSVQTQPCPSVVTDILASWQGRSLFFTDWVSLTQHVTVYSGYHVTAFSKEMPNHIILEVSPLEAVYQLQVSDQTQIWFVTASGLATQQNQANTTVPKFALPSGFQFWEINERSVQPKLHQGLLQLASQIKDSPSLSSIFEVQNMTEVWLRLEKNRTAIFDLQSQFNQVKNLEGVVRLDQTQPLPSETRIIDLRFERPVLRV